MVGILVSFWDGLFSGAMLISGSVYLCCFLDCQLVVNWWFGARWFGYITDPFMKRDCHERATPIRNEAQTTNPNDQFTLSKTNIAPENDGFQ